MANSINTNISAYFAQANIAKATTAAQTSVGRLSSGNFITKAADDVARLSIGTSFTTTVRTLRQALTNASQGVSLLQVADGALGQITEILQRQKTLATQASSGNLSNSDRGFLNQEFQALSQQIDFITRTTSFNGVSLVDGSLSTSSALADSTEKATTALASISLSSNLVATDTITIAGITLTAISSGTPATQEFLIGATTADTIANLANKLNALSTNNTAVTVGGVSTTYAQALGKAEFTARNSTLEISARTGGSLGNNFTVDVSGITNSKATASGAFGGTTIKVFADVVAGGTYTTPFTSSTATVTAATPSTTTAPFKVGDNLTVAIGGSAAQTLYTFKANDGLDDIISGINARSSVTGVSAALTGNSTDGFNIDLKLNQVTGNNISINGGNGFYRSTDGSSFVAFNGATSSTNLFSTALATAVGSPTTEVVDASVSELKPFAAGSRIYASVAGGDYVDILGTTLADGDTATTIRNKINASAGAAQLGIVATLNGNNVAIRFNDSTRTGAISFYSGTSASSNDITTQTAYSTDTLGQAQNFGFGGSYIKVNLFENGFFSPDTSITAATTGARTLTNPIEQGTTITFRLNETAGASTDLAVTVAAGNTLRDIAATINSTAGFVSRGIKASVVADSAGKYNLQLAYAASAVPPAGTAVGNDEVTTGIRIEYASSITSDFNATVALSNTSGVAAQTTNSTYRLFRTDAANNFGAGAPVVVATEGLSSAAAPFVAGAHLFARYGTTNVTLTDSVLADGDTLATIVDKINDETATSGFSATLDGTGSNILLSYTGTDTAITNASLYFSSGTTVGTTGTTFGGAYAEDTAGEGFFNTPGIFNNSYSTINLFAANFDDTAGAASDLTDASPVAANPLADSVDVVITVVTGSTTTAITVTGSATLGADELVAAINDNAQAQARGIRAELTGTGTNAANIRLFIADFNNIGSNEATITVTNTGGAAGSLRASATAASGYTASNALLSKAYGYSATTIATPAEVTTNNIFGLAGGRDNGLGYGSTSVSGAVSDNLLVASSQTASRVNITYADTAASALVSTFANNTVTVAGQAFTFVASAASATEITIGATLQETLDNAAAVINRFGDKTASGDTAFQLNQIEVSRSGNALAFTGKGISSVVKLDGTVSTGITSTVSGVSVSGGGSLNNGSRSGSTPAFGIDVSAVSNAAFTGKIQGFEASYVSADTVNVTLKVGDTTYTASSISTNSTSDQTVRFYSDATTDGGFFDIQLAANKGVSVNNATDAASFATRLNAAFQGLTFNQSRVISSFSGDSSIVNASGTNIGSLVGASVKAQLPSFDSNKLTGISVSTAPAGSADADISLTIDGVQYSTGAIGTKLGANQTYRLFSATDPNFFVDFTTGDSSIDLTTSDNAKAVQEALSEAFGVSEGAAALSFQIGTKSSESLGVNIGSATTQSLYEGKTLSIDTETNANVASAALDIALQTVTSIRANVGALQSRFNFASANIQISVQNQDASRSELLDTDIASESTNYATAQVQLQAGISVLAQANQQLQNLLKLLG